jgi:hypothetical protein
MGADRKKRVRAKISSLAGGVTKEAKRAASKVVRVATSTPQKVIEDVLHLFGDSPKRTERLSKKKAAKASRTAKKAARKATKTAKSAAKKVAKKAKRAAKKKPKAPRRSTKARRAARPTDASMQR